MDPITLHKTFAAKAAATGMPGEFTALVSAFGNEDSQGDIVEKGAFTKTLGEWRAKGRPIPIVWSHQFDDPENFLGEYTSAEETDEGLLLTGQLDLDHPRAARVHKLMQKGVIAEFSISGSVRDYELIEKDKDEDAGDEDFFAGWFQPMRIKDIDLWEAGPCFKGANPETELISVKQDGTRPEAILTRSQWETVQLAARPLAKEGRVLAQKHVDALKEAHTRIGEIIAAAESAPDGEPAAGPPPAAAAEPAKSALSPSVRALLELTK